MGKYYIYFKRKLFPNAAAGLFILATAALGASAAHKLSDAKKSSGAENPPEQTENLSTAFKDGPMQSAENFKAEGAPRRPLAVPEPEPAQQTPGPAAAPATAVQPEGKQALDQESLAGRGEERENEKDGDDDSREPVKRRPGSERESEREDGHDD